ncbi:MAG: CHAT domain-containing protein [Verrucomicrobia bacterium]|nr:CHAT domain-containing protein [Verrucomicrobiota bacterium]MBV8481801.1 CHAT domain-containing protein [Verrucomicrobiota bacterium]
MKSSFLTGITIFVSAHLYVQNTIAASTSPTFDGTWSITESAAEYKNPDGSVAQAFVFHYPAKVKNGILHAEFGARGAVGSFVVDGKIAADGTAVLRVAGTIGNSIAVMHPPPGKPYEWQLIARFDDRHGSGKSVGQIHKGVGRDKFFTFVRDPGTDIYRRVADLLLSQGNVAEGEEILRLLKRKEYNDFFPGKIRDPVADGAPQHAYDQKWKERFDAIHDQLATIGREYSELIKKDPRTDEENQHLSVLQGDLATAQKALEQLYRDIAMIGSPERASDLQESGETLMQNLPTIDSGAVVIETVSLSDKYRVILTTPDVQIPAEYEIAREALRKKVFAFRDAINARAPEAEIKSLANELYQILIGPIERNIQSYQPKTLVWSLDDVLRYVPMAALYDGSHYLAENYANVVITLGSLINLKDKPNSEWTALGLGVTKAHQNLPGLPYVKDELNCIIRDEAMPGDKGILKGRIMLDEAFTEAALRDALVKRSYRVVHVASHFKFDPDGDSNDCFLLLGDKELSKLTLAEIAAIPNFFAGVELLTLSACQTAVGNQASRLSEDPGIEVESLGVLAQRKGASAVVASLWQVADASTSQLMEKFYQCHAGTTITTKAEALREAQLNLLQNTDGKYSHPVYWAPFVVIGNWQ